MQRMYPPPFLSSEISGVRQVRPRDSSSLFSSGAWLLMMTDLPVLTRLQAKPSWASSRLTMILSSGRVSRIL